MEVKRVVGLDGLRALAVAAVVAYHLDEGAVPGGFLGVDVFFVLSGFLITGLVLAEWEQHGRLAIVPFWRRRARRLLPPLLVTLVVVAAAVPVLYDDVAGRVRGQVVAAVLQAGNWFEALAGHSYFEELGRPSPLTHLWSLGVEAQFYLVWPLVAVLALALGGRRLLGLVAAGGAALSFGAMAVAYSPGEDPSRLYYGADTRAGTLLVGALLACAVPLTGRRRVPAPPARVVVAVAGAVAGLGLAALVWTLDGASATTYRGGLLLAALLSAVLVTTALQPGGYVARVLALPPLVWLGTRSYAVYLWHWPVFTATRPGVDVGFDGVRLLVVRLVLTAVLAEATTRSVAALGRSSLPAVGRRRLALGGAALAVGLAGVAGAAASPGADEPVFFVSPTTTSTTATTIAPTTTTTTTSAAPTTTTAPVAVATTLPATTTTTTTAPPLAAPIRAVAVGESVLLGAAGEVQRALGPGTVVDADIARQPDDVLAALQAHRDAARLQGVAVLVVQLGSNGPVRPEHVERLAALAGGVPRVVAVTVWVPGKPWVEESNRALHDAAARFPWLRLADWHGAARDHPEWLGPDGVHAGPEGARQYAALVAAAASAA